MVETKKKKSLLSIVIYCLIFLFLFTEGINDGFITNTLTNAIAVVTMATIFAYVIFHKAFYFDSFSVIFALFTVFCFLSILWSDDKSRAIENSMIVLRLCVYFVLAESFLIKDNDIDALLLTICLSGIAYGIYYCAFFGVSNIFSSMSSGVRLGEIDNSNAIGCRLALCSILCLWYTVKKHKKLMFIGYAISLVGALATGSRTAVGICLMGALLILIIGEQRRGFVKRILLVGVAASVAYVVLMSGAISTVSDRFDDLFKNLSGEKGDISSEYRIKMIEYGWQQFFKTPILGIGIGNSNQVAKLVNFRYAEGYLHNNYIELLVSLGIVGTAIYYSFFIVPLHKIIKNFKKKNIYMTLSLALIAALLLGQLGSVQYGKKYVYMYFLLMYELSKMKNNNSENMGDIR